MAGVVFDASALVEVLPRTSHAPAHTYTWLTWLGAVLPVTIFAVLLLFLGRKHLRERQHRILLSGVIIALFTGTGVALLAQLSQQHLSYTWLGAALPVVIFVVLLILLLREHLRERWQRVWMAGFIVVLCLVAAGVALLAQVSMDAAALVASAFVLAGSIRILWHRHHVGALLLALELGPSWPGFWFSPWLWYGVAVSWAGLGLLSLLSRHHPLWFAPEWSMVLYSLVMAQGRRRLEVRERGLVLSPSGYIPWRRITSYTLGDMTLTIRHRPPLGPSSWPSQVELRCSPEQRQALGQVLSQHVPVTPTDTFERR